MRSWSQLEADFRSVRTSGFGPRLDHQHGASGEYWRLVSASSPEARAQFEALARLAGEKLLEVPAIAEQSSIVAESNPVVRWYQALRQLSGAYRTDLYATETNGTGAIFISKIDDVCATSATLCTVLESLSAVPRRPLEMLAGVPRYAGPYGHWRGAQDKVSANEPDFAGAAREAINAVEGLCRVILGDESLTLGRCLTKLRERGLLDPALAKGLDALWGFASAEPGIRHGAARTPTIRPRDARYVVEASNAALVLLLSIDAGQD